MLKQRLSQLEEIAYNPIFILLMMPLSYLMIGTLLALRFTSLQFLNFIFLYLFVLIHQFLKKQVTKVDILSKNFYTPIWLLMGLVSLLLIAYFTFKVNFLIGILLFFYSIVIHFHYYLKERYFPFASIVLLAVFKGLILTLISFFIQTPFISFDLFKWSLPLILVNVLVEFGEYINELGKTQEVNEKGKVRIIIFSLLGVIYFISLFGFFPTFSYYLVFFLLTIPILIQLINSYTKDSNIAPSNKRVRRLFLFSISYYFSFFLVILFSSILFN